MKHVEYFAVQCMVKESRMIDAESKKMRVTKEIKASELVVAYHHGLGIAGSSKQIGQS